MSTITSHQRILKYDMLKSRVYTMLSSCFLYLCSLIIDISLLAAHCLLNNAGMAVLFIKMRESAMFIHNWNLFRGFQGLRIRLRILMMLMMYSTCQAKTVFHVSAMWTRNKLQDWHIFVTEYTLIILLIFISIISVCYSKLRGWYCRQRSLNSARWFKWRWILFSKVNDKSME